MRFGLRFRRNFQLTQIMAGQRQTSKAQQGLVILSKPYSSPKIPNTDALNLWGPMY